ncbi:Uncharacterized SAM-binding protein YcdF, DUF218 family [Lishizhenia tianjinensis]|uniref:Uncharacterized SAM-binding protein YcdF, DUF218 family n=1 Tax=Lishizhenia tianjinensis TaxID=477690 RepID=A0A1I7AKI4_9FLAO|nr:YdcF family protein [Lishizhenia tianjinensis]SFT75355.1 Uncharacterized SAM-binding protein YcdF, DUF218 family [Lishizhenia tianjinensis]
MFFILSKIVYFFLQPLVWVIVLLVLTILIKSVKWKKRLGISTVVITLVFSNPALLKVCLHGWEIHAVKTEELKDYQTAIVLSGMIEWDSDAGRISCRRGIDRLWQTLHLYKTGRVEKILITGDSGYVFGRDLREAERLKNELVSFDFPSEDILVETQSRNTYENALYSKDIIDSLGLENLLLVTSARHMRRAKAVFENLNIPVDVFPTDQYTGNDLYLYWDEYVLPSGEAFSGWTDLIKEMVGYIVYDIKGYI